MTTLHSRVRDGRIEVAAPADWPDGTPVEILPLAGPTEPVGMREEDWPTDPEGVADLLSRWEAHEPLVMTPEEEADLAAWRQRVKEYTIANQAKDVEGRFP